MASYYCLKLGEPLRLLRIGELILKNAGVKLRGPMKHVCSVMTSRTYCSDVSTRRKQVNCVPETSSSSFFSRQIQTLHSPRLVNKMYYTSWGSSFPFINFTSLNMPVRLVKFSEILKLFCRNQNIWSTSFVVKGVALPNTSWFGSSLIPVWTLHSGRLQKYSQNRSTNLTAVGRCCYSSHAVSSELKDNENKEKKNQMKIHMSDLVYKLFSGRYNYRALHRKVIFENCLFGKEKTSVGILSYAFELLKLRLRIHSQCTGTSVEIGSVRFLEDGVIRIRWRLKVFSQNSVLKALRFININADCLEACSYFHVDESGMVKKHRIEKVMPSSKETTAS